MSTQLFQLEQSCLRLLGHNMEDFQAKDIKVRDIVVWVLIGSAFLPMTAFAITHSDQVEVFTAALTFGFTAVLSTVKISTFLYNKRKFMTIMKSFRQLYQDMNRRAPEGIRFVDQAHKLSTTLAKVYYRSCAVTNIVLFIRPILKMIYSKSLGLPFTREQAIPMTLPINEMNSPTYEVVYLATFVASSLVVVYVSAIEGLFVAFALNLRAQFYTLQHKIEPLAFDQEESKVDREIADVAKYHIRLLNLCIEMNSIYAPIIVGQFFIASLQIGVILYQITKQMDSVLALLLNLSFLGSIMLQLFIYCYGGEMIKTESMQTSIAVQLSDWDMATPKHRRSLVFIMQRAQKEMKIEAGIYEASLESYLTICKAAMSLIAIFQSIE